MVRFKQLDQEIMKHRSDQDQDQSMRSINIGFERYLIWPNEIDIQHEYHSSFMSSCWSQHESLEDGGMTQYKIHKSF